jgi:hypothetical protein
MRRACSVWSAGVGGCRTPRCIRHGGLELEPRGPGAAVHQLFLEGREERLGDGVDAPMVVKSVVDVDVVEVDLLFQRVS